MNVIETATAVVIMLGAVGGSALTLNKMHVASEDFDAYLEQRQMTDDEQYLLNLKADIRELRALLLEYPDEEDFQEDLIELMDKLCLRLPSDRMCQ